MCDRSKLYLTYLTQYQSSWLRLAREFQEPQVFLNKVWKKGGFYVIVYMIMKSVEIYNEQED